MIASMTDKIFNFPNCFSKTSKKDVVPIYVFESGDFEPWLKKQTKPLQTQVIQAGFEGNAKEVLSILATDGSLKSILFGLSYPVHHLDAATLQNHIQSTCSKYFLNQHVFKIESLHEEDVSNKIAIGWGLAAYKFDHYKKREDTLPSLLWPEKADRKIVNATIEATFTLRNLVNVPASDLGTDELADAAKIMAKKFKADTKIIKGDKLKSKNFPLIYAVGKASPREPQLVDMRWSGGKKDKKNPNITIVGKGIIYDTGGLNLKPGQYMREMKKDMGGAAHALGVAYMIMALNLPINLRVLLPIAENSVAGNAYRPGDILGSRKGLTIEIENTDAEGRLVLADALAYACEETPDLLVDFATLTGAARVAVGYDMPAFLSNNDEIADDIRQISFEQNDPCWPFPLFKGYEPNIKGSISDLRNDGTGRAGHIEAALILQQFINNKVDWVHFDCFAWEQNGKAGRPKGGAETGLYAMFNFIKQKYG